MTNQLIREKFGNNLRFLRNSRNLTQKELATAIAPHPKKVQSIAGNIGSYEEGRAFPQPELMQNLLSFFSVSYEALIGEDLSRKAFSPEPAQAIPMQVLAVPVDKQGNERIAMVPDKAAAGYVKGYADREYIKELDSFHLPWLPTGSTYRAFEISGDSMPPIQPGSVVLGKYVEKGEIKSGERYILITKDGIVFKRVYPQMTPAQEAFLLTSDNPIFAPYPMPLQDIQEVWQFYAYISMCQNK
ncbi:MAG: LexA family transcriptional regulator [Bacteroidota bacterium]